jgi:hypothetical protein
MNEMHYTFRRLDARNVETMRSLNSVFAEAFDDRDTYLEAPAMNTSRPCSRDKISLHSWR